MRRKSAFKNSSFAIIQKIVEIVLSFIYRTVFINTLGVTYLGISGLFTNIFSILSLMELGIGSSIVFLMYKPIADKDNKTLKSLLKIYSKFYNIVAFLVALVGIVLIPFLPNIIKNYNAININLIPIYLLTLSSIVASYFAAYKRSLLEADQKAYMNSINYSIFNIIGTTLRMALLLLYKNYIICLIANLLMVILSNVSISRKVDKIYPFIKEKKIIKLQKEKVKEIYARMRAATMHQVGNAVANSKDSIVIAGLIGINTVGIYSNYIMMTTIIYTMFSLVFCSITANVGNMKLEENNDKSISVYNRLFMLNFYMYFIACSTFCAIINNFIKVWIGDSFIFPSMTVILITLSLYVSGMRHTQVTFINSSGLNYNTRYKAIIEAVINIVVSIVLCKMIGINGAILGTIISFVFVSVWFEPYVLYKEWFKSNVWRYYIKYILYFILIVVTTFVLILIIKYIPSHNITYIFLQGIICVVLDTIVFSLIFGRTEEFKYYLNIIKSMMLKIKRKLLKIN